MLICGTPHNNRGTGFSLGRLIASAVLAAASLSAVTAPAVAAALPEGVWLNEPNFALQVFDCDGLLCGRVVWLRNVRDPKGQIQHDKLNPDPVLRQRLLCGLTVMWALRPNGENAWKNGWFYNPDDGKTYRINAQLHAPDTIVARVYVGIPLFGETRTLHRVPHLESAGWC